MADEIISKLGFDVQQALAALQRFDTQLQTSASALRTHAGQLNAWNSQAQAALATMRQMATAAAQLGTMPSLPTPGVAAVPTAAAGAQLWLPPGTQTKIDQATQSMTNLSRVSTTAGRAMTDAGTKGSRALDQASKSARGVGMSIEMIGRIIITQAIVRSLSMIRNMLRSTVEESIKFQKSISEVLMITMTPLEGSMQAILSTFQTLTDEAAEMAKRFNIELGQVVEGIYQTISNQFVEVSDRTRIMEASMKLARVGVMDLKDSVLLLTGALNAYGMSSQNADRVAAMFFRTIQLGRIRGKELADTLGTIVPIAAQLNISLEEITASYVSLTIGGIEARKASTGLRTAMLAFIKPSEHMKKILRELGYANAEQIIQALGFVGALKAIGDASKGMASEYAKSIRRVRALTAVLALTRNDTEAYEKAIEAMSMSSAEHLDQLWKKFKEMPAEKLTHDVNKIKVTLTQDLGAALVEILSTIMRFAGGADSLTAAIKAATAAAATLAIGLGILAIKAMLANAALGPIGLGLMAISALVALGIYRSASEIAAIRAVALEREMASEKEIRAIERQQQKRRQALIEQRREENRVWEEGMAIIRRDYFKVMDDLKFKNKERIEDTRQTLASIVRIQERVVSAYRNAAKAAADAVRASRERQISAEAAYSDAVFKYATKNEGVYQRAESYMRRAVFLARDAEKAMRKAKTPEEIATATAIFQRAEAVAQEAENIASGTKSVILQEDAQRAVLFIMRQKIEAEQELQRIQVAEATRLAKEAANEANRLNKMKILMKAILEDLQAFDKTGAKEPEVLEKQEARLKLSLKYLRQLWLEAPQLDITDMMALDKLQQRVQMAIEGGIPDIEVQKLFALPETFANFRADIERGVGPVRVFLEEVTPKLTPRIRAMLEGASAEERLSILSSEMGQTNETLQKYEEMGAAVAIANKKISAHQENARKSLDDWVKEGLRPENWSAEIRLWRSKPKLKVAADHFIEMAHRFLTIPTVALEESDFIELHTAYQLYLGQIKPPKEAREILAKFISKTAEAASEAKQKADVLKGMEVIKPRALEVKALRPALQEAYEKAKAIHDAIKAAEETIRQAKQEAAAAAAEVTAVSQIDMSNLAIQTASAADAMWDLAFASMSVQTPIAPEMAAHGGRVGRYLAAGGPVGTDVIPTWLSRGEFVMNAQATRQFASQLVAMNAGVQPAFRSEGGSVTNIGDINVTVQGGATGRQTARSIATGLRRELRRGTVTL